MKSEKEIRQRLENLQKIYSGELKSSELLNMDVDFERIDAGINTLLWVLK